MDCQDHVVPPVKFLEPCDSNQSAASLTLHENDAVHVQLTSGNVVVKPRRRKTTRSQYRFWKSRWNNESVCDASGLGGFVRRYLSTRSLRITSNFFRLYHVPCVSLCTLSLSCQNTHETTKKAKQKKTKKKIVRCQCTTKLTQVSSFSESHTSHGRARHQIRD